VRQRPVVRYHGGKWKLAKWIIGHFPAHRVYVEPFGGGASVLLQKPRSYAEVYNDLDGEIVNVFVVLRDSPRELIRAIHLTPFARAEFEQAYEPADNPVEQARRTIARSFMGFGGSAAVSGETTGFRANSNRRGTTPARDWANLPDCLALSAERLRGVVIEQREAVDCMRQLDNNEALHYVDPPYVHSTRSAKVRGTPTRKNYRHEMSDADHDSLAVVLRSLVGTVIVSGYRCDLYDKLYAEWQRVDRASMADGAKPRVESLWLSPNCAKAGLFGYAA
jgi:DNA adenine methylase